MHHVLPKNYAKVRYYGLLAGRNKFARIQKLKLLNRTAIQKIAKRALVEILNEINGKEVTKCECGGSLKLHKINKRVY